MNGSQSEADKVDPVALRASASTWIASADTKAIGLLAVSGALLAAVAFATGANPTRVEQLLVLLFCLSTVLSIAMSALVLSPKMDRKAVLGDGAHIERSFSFFAELGELNFDDFKRHISGATKDDIARDATEQAYVVLWIARRKMVLMRWSVRFLVASLVLVTSFVFVRAFEIGATNSETSAPAVSSPGSGENSNGSGARPAQPLDAR